MNSLVSIIVPVYNVEKYLRQCLKSVEQQDYDRLQVIIVNDGSTDCSKEICEEYLNKNPDWIMINQSNQGLSAARNAGIERAMGQYITFLDSDDWLDKHYISTLVEAAIKYNAEIVETGVIWKYPSYERIEVIDTTTVFNMRGAMKHYLLQTNPIHSCACGKLYQRKLFDDLRFVVGRLHEDGFFMYQAIYRSKTFVALNYAGYYYRQNREGSIMTVTVKPKNITDVMDMMEQRLEFFKEKQETALYRMAEAYYYRTALTNYITSVKIIKDKKLSQELKEKLKNGKKSIFSNRYLGIKKLKFILYFYFPLLFKAKYLR